MTSITPHFDHLLGYANGNGSVATLDLRAFGGAFGSPSVVFDFGGDGETDAAALVAVRERFGVTG